ncbi:hypothetical protein [Streptomyces griseoaurantiacus]|uniref:hypothetical protein n=1 Tax=Streptomyces griseoaurantiacus TaxID=68213 RepID=UPI0036963DAD
MRVTAALITKATAHLADATNGGYKSLTGGSNTGRPGTTWSANFDQRIFDSARGENRAALAFFLGVMREFGVMTPEWNEVWADLAISFPGTQKWLERGQVDAQKQKTVIARKAVENTAPTPRRVTSSTQDLNDETGYDGTNWATYSVEVWITNDSSFFDTAQNYARFDETGEQLAQYVDRLLFDRAALAPEERRRITRDDVHTLKLVAGDLTRDGDSTPAREALKRADWKRIGASLTDGQ